MLTFHNLKSMPKIDLHRHFEGSLRLETLVELANTHHLNVPHTLEELRPLVQVTNEPPDAQTFLAKFPVLRNFYCSPEVIRRLAYEIVEDAARDNIHYLELRFSPQALSRVKGFAVEDVTDWVLEAVHQAGRDYGIEVNLIVTLLRHEEVAVAQKVAQIAFERRHKGVVGVDLAGDENFSLLPFKEIFREAKELGFGVTIHAGEWLGPEEVRLAIEQLHADRIGHGINVIGDSHVVQLVKQNRVALEICLTSNMQTGAVPALTQHPIQDLINMNVPVTLNTDDPTVSNITLTDEYHIGMSVVGLDYDDLRKMTLTAVEAAFVDEANRKRLYRHFDRLLPKPEIVAAFYARQD